MLSICLRASHHPAACQTHSECNSACHSPFELCLRLVHRPFAFGHCLETVSPSLRIHLGLGVAMELALNVIGQMASHGEPRNSLCFQAGSERRRANSKNWVISQSI